MTTSTQLNLWSTQHQHMPHIDSSQMILREDDYPEGFLGFKLQVESIHLNAVIYFVPSVVHPVIIEDIRVLYLYCFKIFFSVFCVLTSVSIKACREAWFCLISQDQQQNTGFRTWILSLIITFSSTVSNLCVELIEMRND